MNNLLRSIAIITDKSAAENIGGMWATVITGIVLVFLVLAILIAFISLLGLISNAGHNKKDKPALQDSADNSETTVSEEIPEESYDENDEEIIAVISAAIAAYGEQDGKSYTIRKIKRSEKQPRSGWGNAGVSENTRPF